MNKIYVIESTPRGRPVYKDVNSAQYLGSHISKVDCLRDLDMNGKHLNIVQYSPRLKILCAEDLFIRT